MDRHPDHWPAHPAGGKRGALKAGGMVASMDQGGSPITWLLIQLFTWQNVVGFAVIGIIYLAGVLLTWRRARGFIAAEKAEKSAAPQQSTGMS